MSAAIGVSIIAQESRPKNISGIYTRFRRISLHHATFCGKIIVRPKGASEIDNETSKDNSQAGYTARNSKPARGNSVGASRAAHGRSRAEGTMKTLVITRELLDYDNYYIGNENVANFQGHIEIESNLGHVRFKTQLSAAGRILS